jgi:hypothetical protein
MDMSIHQAKGMNSAVGKFLLLLKDQQKPTSIGVIRENILAAIAT